MRSGRRNRFGRRIYRVLDTRAPKDLKESSISTPACRSSIDGRDYPAWFASHPPDQINFGLTIGSPVGVEYIMEPDGRFRGHVWALPTIPREAGLLLTVDEAPVDHAD